MLGRHDIRVRSKDNVYRRFGAEYAAEAYRWLAEEHILVVEHNKGIRRWIRPSKRINKSPTFFRNYVTAFIHNYRKKAGTPNGC